MRQSTVFFLIKTDKTLLQNSFVNCLEILLKYVWFPIWVIFGLGYSLFCSTLNFYLTAKEFSLSVKRMLESFQSFFGGEEFWTNSMRCWKMWMLYFFGCVSCFSILWQPFWLSWISWSGKTAWIEYPYFIGADLWVAQIDVYTMKNFIPHLATL